MSFHQQYTSHMHHPTPTPHHAMPTSHPIHPIGMKRSRGNQKCVHFTTFVWEAKFANRGSILYVAFSIVVCSILPLLYFAIANAPCLRICVLPNQLIMPRRADEYIKHKKLATRSISKHTKKTEGVTPHERNGASVKHGYEWRSA